MSTALTVKQVQALLKEPSRLQTLISRPSRIADALREPRPMVIPSTGANALGLQVARALKDRALWHARASRVTEATRDAYETLHHDGVVVIRDFLPAPVFGEVLAEYNASQTHDAGKWTSFGENVGARDLLISDYLDRYPATARAFRDSEFLLDLSSAISRRPRSFKPHMMFFTVKRTDPGAPHVDLDYNQFAHADRHYAFIKAFFYIHDVDEDTAPFCYAKGSHRMSMARAKFEYDYSVRFSKISKIDDGERTEQNLLVNEELRDCADRLMDAMATPCLPIVAPRNTLIVANTQGFHRRGELRSSRERATVNLDFKYVESAARWLYPALKHLYQDP